jgi:hypothetical protein
MREGIFVGPQITQLFEDKDFSTKLTSTERRAWKAFENVCRNFLDNERAQYYGEIVQELISSHGVVECNMQLKLNFLYSYLEFFLLKKLQPSQMNMTKGFIRILPKLKRRIVENGVKICCPATVGVLHGRHQPAKIREKRKGTECLINIFLVRMPYIGTLFIIWYCTL